VTGLSGHRVYLDWNATAPLRPEARAAMLEAMDLIGNPTSVHAEGRAAKAVVEKARAQVAALVGCEQGEVVFTSGATEAAAIIGSAARSFAASEIEHDCVRVWSNAAHTRPIGRDGRLACSQARLAEMEAVQAANSETGVLQPLEDWSTATPHLTDAAQALGKIAFSFGETSASFALVSGHKFGAPKGTGALIVRQGLDIAALLKGGGQEQGRRSGTENVIGIAGFGAAAEAAKRDLEAGVWNRVEKLRDALEDKLAAAAPDIIIFGKDVSRLPNTSCFAIRGWRGETQVMQMDLAGFAVSAGSACSSGKVGPSRVILAMTGDEELARSALRVSLGPTTTEAEVMAFADAWIEHYARRAKSAA